MVYFVYNGYGYHAGHHFTFGWAHDSGAQVNYDEYGSVSFGSNGFGENDKVKVQLAREYNRYFCSTASCGGFSNWISGNVEYFTVKEVCPNKGAKLSLVSNLNEYRTGYWEAYGSQYTKGESCTCDEWHVDCTSGCFGSWSDKGRQGNVDQALDRSGYIVVSSEFYNAYRTEINNFIGRGHDIYKLIYQRRGYSPDEHCYQLGFDKIAPCIPNWQCEQPLNGYESDECGNRRLNSVCNPECSTGQTKTQVCNDGTIIITHICQNGKWVATNNQCPSIPPPECTAGQTRTAICVDGSTIITHECEGGKWVATDKKCPTPECSPDGTTRTINCLKNGKTYTQKCVSGKWVNVDIEKCEEKEKYTLYYIVILIIIFIIIWVIFGRK